MPRAFSVACLLGVFAAGSVLAQQPGRVPYPPPPTSLVPQRAAQPQRPAATPASGGAVMHFRKPADATVPVSGSGGVVPAQAAIPVPPGTGLPPLPAQPAFAAGGQKDKEKPVPLPSQSDIEEYTKLAGPERIFAMHDDEGLRQIIRQDILDKMKKDGKIEGKIDELGFRFPQYPSVGGGLTYVPKTANYPPMRVTYDALYVVHRRLHFEDMNTERYGWDLGIIQPAVSALAFYKDVFFWPHSLASGCARGFWDTNAGKCLPGSPTPYMLYPPGLTITGSVFEGVIVTGMAFAIP